MFHWRRIFLLLPLLLLNGGQLFAASSAERRAFGAGVEAFRMNLPSVAEIKFSQFAQEYPQSELLAQAVLFQAEARYQMGHYDRAITLLLANQPKAQWLADQYLYWIAESQLAGGNFAAAADSFARLVESFPLSTNCLSASVREAEARARLQQWPRVTELLQNADGIFQQAVKTNSTNDLAVTGYLIFGEAQLAQGDFVGAHAVLDWLARQNLKPHLTWRRSYLEARVQLAEGKVNEALQLTTNLIVQARTANDPVFQAESVQLLAGIFERLGLADEAISAYKTNLVAASTPADWQRTALLKVAELNLARNQIGDATQSLEEFLTRHPNSAAVDQGLLTLGELRLKQFLTESAATNLLSQALGNFDKLLNTFPTGALAARGWLNRGWCLWLQDEFARSQEAFQFAAASLPFSEEQAVARFKWADAQSRLKDFSGAITNYNFLVEHYAGLPGVKERMLEPALYQALRAALETGDLDAATNALEKILAWYPQGFAGDRGLLLTGDGFSRAKNPGKARELFARFDEKYPASSLAPEVRLAIARSYEQEKNWDAAITNYDAWLGSFTNHSERAMAEFSRAWDYSTWPGHETNAFMLFTNFVTRFRTNQLVLQAQWWIGDYLFGKKDWTGAEARYQLVFINTNWPPSELTYQAQMMAGCAAVARQAYKEATNYFSDLANDTNCPLRLLPLQLKAAFACGDALMLRTDPDPTNRQAELREAIDWFNSIAEKYPTNDIAPLAWGRIGDCYLQLAASGTNLFYSRATNAYHQVLNLPQASLAARSQAKVGLGIVAETLAKQKSGEEQIALLTQALGDYYDVFIGSNLRDGEHRDPFWVKEAGLRAFRVASEDLKDRNLALSICTNLAEQVPQLRTVFENKASRLKEQLPNATK